MSELARNWECDPSESATTFRADGMVLQFADGAIAACNAVAAEILGYTADQLIGKALFDSPRQFIHLDGSAFLPEENPALVALRSGQPCSNVTIGFYRQDGELVWLLLDAQPLFRANESAPYAVVTTIARPVEKTTSRAGRMPTPQEFLQKSTDVTAQNRQDFARSAQQDTMQTTEANLRLFIKYAPVCIAMFDRNMNYVALSQRWVEIYQLESVEAVLGRSHYEVFPQISDRWRQAHQRGLAGEIQQCEEDSFTLADGSLQWLRWEIRPWHAEGGDIGGIVIFVADISDRKRTEVAQRQSEERYRALIELSPQIVFISDPDGSIIYCNQWGLEFTGRSLQELQGDGWVDLVRPDARDRVYTTWQTATKQVSDYEIEIPFRRADGVYRWIYTRALPVRDNNGKIDYWIGVALDISDRKQIEQELQQTNQTLRTLIESSPLPIVALEANATVRMWNKAATEVFGWSEAEVLNRPIPIVPPDQLDECQQLRAAVANGETLFGMETYRRKQDGSELIVSISAAPVYGNSGSIDEIMLIFQDISPRKQIEAALRESEHRYRTLFETMDQGFCVCEMLFSENGEPIDYRFLEVNHVFEQMTGLEQAMGKTARQLVPNLEAFWFETYGRVALTGEPARFENQSTAMNRWFDVSAFRIGDPQSHKFAILFTNISDRKQTEQSWRESEERLRLGMQVAGFALAKFDYASNTVELSKEAAAVYGLPAGELVVPRSRIHATFHPEEREELLEIIAQVLDPSGTGWFSRDHRVVWGNGEVRWLTVRKQVFFDRASRDVTCNVSTARRNVSTARRNVSTARPTHAILAAIDISDRKQAELALAESESRFRTLADNIAQLAWMTDSNGWIFWYNQRWFEYTGTTLEEMQGWGWQKVHHPDHIERVVEHFRHCLKIGEPWEDTFPLLGKDGTYRWFLSRAIPIRDEQGNVVRWFGTNTDISDRKQAEIALQQSEERLRLALNAAHQGLYDLNIQTGEAIVSPEYAQMLGYDPQEFHETNAFWLERLHPDDRERVSSVYQEYITGRRDQYQVEFRQRTKSGDWKWILSIGSIVAWDGDGNPLRMLGIHADISDRKQAELEREYLLARERHYSEQLQGLTAAALAINSALSVEEVLQAIADRAAAIVGSHQSVTSIIVNNNWEQAINAVYLSDKYAQWRDYDAKTDGSGIYTCVCHLNRPMRMTQAELETHPHWQGFGKEALNHPPMRGWLAAPLVGRDGHNIGLIQLSDKYEGDFTETDEAVVVQLAQMASIAVENVRLYEAEQQAREEAQTANRLKDEFLAVLSHELRSPLNPILGWTKLLQTRKLNPERTVEALTTIERNAKLQAQLIEDLLDISRIMRGKLTLNSAPVSLPFVIYSALETVRLAAEAKNIQFNLALDSTVGEVLGDAGRLQQVVWNLLSNAVKFTPAGGQVTIRLTQVDTDAQIQIIDTGKGINPKFLPYVFEYFRQEDGSTTRKFGGLGLGLAIARQIVEMHGGRISADSPGVGFGATFTVKLPTVNGKLKPAASRAIAASSPSAPKTPLTGMRILVVDDTADTREFLTFLLEENGAIVLAVSSATEALQTFGEFQPDIILSDIGMPEMDGYELMRSIRRLEAGRSIPAIALTAYAGEIDQKQAIAAGFQRHVAKPIDPDRIISYIVELVQQKE
ncbi:PAS domain S-box protein [Microseira wollei]|uniref:Circadian input-output histidine kinase CikA n=1 Tax=Microseira wollei NIES-4236 TaxID=2530354 RepID=A0AAV3XBX3_9CYAN|nr:PAS domain S-box protein [Microseira wollei]GET39799.1 multi-sensor Hybrid Histidine Kinase [Microseira wollei NIES-4236]